MFIASQAAGAIVPIVAFVLFLCLPIFFLYEIFGAKNKGSDSEVDSGVTRESHEYWWKAEQEHMRQVSRDSERKAEMELIEERRKIQDAEVARLEEEARQDAIRIEKENQSTYGEDR